MANTDNTQKPYQLEAPEPVDMNALWKKYKEDGSPMLDAIMGAYKPPVQEVTPEQAQKAKFGAALTDSMTSLAEMFAHGNGALVRNREGATSTQTTNARLKELQDKYDKDLLQYNSIKGNAEQQDFAHHVAQKQQNEGKKREYILYKEQQAEKQAAIEREQKRNDDEIKRLKVEFDKQMGIRQAEINTRNPTVPKLTPSDIVQIQQQAEQLDKQWLIDRGYLSKQVMLDKVTKRPTGEYTYKWDAKATPEIKLALIEAYRSENHVQPKAYQPKPGEYRGADGKWYRKAPTSSQGTQETGTTSGNSSSGTSGNSSSGNLY